MTGIGFCTRFSVPGDVPKLPDETSFQIDDVAADMNSLSHGAGFLLFVKQGPIYMLVD